MREHTVGDFMIIIPSVLMVILLLRGWNVYACSVCVREISFRCPVQSSLVHYSSLHSSPVKSRPVP